MTSEQAAPGEDPLALMLTPPFFWLAVEMSERRNDAVKNVTHGIDTAGDEWAGKLDALQQGLGMITQRDPRKRLEAYYSKPDTYAEGLALFASGEAPVVYSWESQRAYFPRDYEEDWDDFSKLRERAEDGDFGPELQAREIAYQIASQEPISDAIMPDMSDGATDGEESLQPSDGGSQPELESGT